MPRLRSPRRPIYSQEDLARVRSCVRYYNAPHALVLGAQLALLIHSAPEPTHEGDGRQIGLDKETLCAASVGAGLFLADGLLHPAVRHEPEGGDRQEEGLSERRAEVPQPDGARVAEHRELFLPVGPNGSGRRRVVGVPAQDESCSAV